MPTIIETTVYTFAELSDRAKDRARDWYRESQAGDPYVLESSLEDIARACESLGITLSTTAVPLMNKTSRRDPVIHYSVGDRGEYCAFSGSYSYRKGAAKAILEHFGGSDGETLVSIAKSLQDVQRRYFYKVIAHMTTRRESMAVDVEFDSPPYREVSPADCETVGELLQDVAHWGLRLMSRELDYQNSNEVVDETIALNDYTFDEDGNREG